MEQLGSNSHDNTNSQGPAGIKSPSAYDWQGFEMMAIVTSMWQRQQRRWKWRAMCVVIYFQHGLHRPGPKLPTFGLAPRAMAIQTVEWAVAVLEYLLLRTRAYLAFLFNYTSGRSYWNSHFYNGLLHQMTAIGRRGVGIRTHPCR